MWSLEYTQVSAEEDVINDNSASVANEDSILRKYSNGLDKKCQMLSSENDAEEFAINNLPTQPTKKMELIKQLSKLNSQEDNGLYNQMFFILFSSFYIEKDFIFI